MRSKTRPCWALALRYAGRVCIHYLLQNGRGDRGGGFQDPPGIKNTTLLASGKNCRYFHTLGYEIGNFQKSVFFHTQKVLFHTLKNNFIPWNLFHTFKFFFIPWKLFSYPYTTISYLLKTVFVSYCAFHFIPSTSISYPEHGEREMMLFIGTWFSNLCTAVHTTA